MIVGICGYGNSGASAVLDYLRGYNELSFFCDCEFQLLHEIDGISDLKYHLVYSRDRIACNAAINRFIKMQKYGSTGKMITRIIGNQFANWYMSYVDELVLAQWKGEESSLDPCDISDYSENRCIYYMQRGVDIFLKRINKKFSYPLPKTRYFSILNEDDFDNITKAYLKKLFRLLNFDENNITVIDMLFSFTNPTQGMEYFDSVKNIVVNRDPRDVYVSSKLHPYDSRFMPNDDVKKYVNYYRALQKSNSHDKRVLVIQYEDLIYKYENTRKLITNFLGIKNEPDKEFELFDPTYSEKYTNRIELYNQYREDISYIENELPEYLYDFSAFDSPRNNKELIKRKKDVKYKGLNIK